jgi:hypothetical protein
LKDGEFPTKKSTRTNLHGQSKSPQFDYYNHLSEDSI